jgi:hypothetical protein
VEVGGAEVDDEGNLEDVANRILDAGQRIAIEGVEDVADPA